MRERKLTNNKKTYGFYRDNKGKFWVKVTGQDQYTFETSLILGMNLDSRLRNEGYKQI